MRTENLGPNFNWFEFLGDSEQGQKFKEHFSKLIERSVVKGEIIAIDKCDNEVVIRINNYLTCIIPFSEIRYNRSLNVGSIIDIYIENIDKKRGFFSVSHRKARMYKYMNDLEKAYKDQDIIKGRIRCRTAGGMVVEISGIDTFLPLSEIGNKPLSNYDDYINMVMDFKIIMIDYINWIVVVSHKIIENPVFKMSSIAYELELYEDFLFPSFEYTLEDFINDGFPNKAKRRKNKFVPHVDEMVRTHGRITPCPHCGSENIRKYTDGTAECLNCNKWYYYA